MVGLGGDLQTPARRLDVSAVNLEGPSRVMETDDVTGTRTPKLGTHTSHQELAQFGEAVSPSSFPVTIH